MEIGYKIRNKLDETFNDVWDEIWGWPQNNLIRNVRDKVDSVIEVRISILAGENVRDEIENNVRNIIWELE